MVTSISSAFSSPSPAESASSSAPATINPVVKTPNNTAEDTVELTAAQQVYNLYNAGQTVSQISFTMHLSVGVVNGYLGISGGSQ